MATSDSADSALRALLVGRPSPASPTALVALAEAARVGEVVMLACEAEPRLAPLLNEPLRRCQVIGAHLELATLIAAEALARGRNPGPAILLKGGAAARWVYAKPELRFRRDVDLLVADVPAVRDALLSAGFVDRVDPARKAAGPARVRTWPMAKATAFGEVELDLHAALVEAPWCRPDHAAMFADAVAATPFPITSAADTLVHAAIHLVENGFRQPLKHWVDVDRLARIVPPQVLTERARRHHARVATWAALMVSQRWFETPADAHLAALGRPAHAALVRVFLAGRGRHPHRLGRAPARHLARLLAADDSTTRLAYLRWLASRSPT